MANSTAIITFIPIDSEVEYIVRTMRNIDEQSSDNWYHFIYCETEVLVAKVTSLLSLRSSSYPTKVSIQLYSTFDIANISTHEYVCIHPVRDTWSPLFIEKMVLELMSCPVTIAGIWCQYNKAQEVIRGKIISFDSVSPGPEYSGELILPTYRCIKETQFIQSLYHTTDVHLDTISILTHPMTLAATILIDRDILAIHDTLATISVQQDTPQSRLEFQQIRNTLFRQFPRLGVSND